MSLERMERAVLELLFPDHIGEVYAPTVSNRDTNMVCEGAAKVLAPYLLQVTNSETVERLAREQFGQQLDLPSERMLCLSTAHITRDCNEWLRHEVERTASATLIPYLITYDKPDAGYFIPLTDSVREALRDDDRSQVPDELIKVLEFAIAHQFDWLMFDRDAEQISELPAYPWG